MNQILQIEMKKNKNKPADIKKIVMFFAVSMIIFGTIILGQGIYAISKNSKDKNNNNIVVEKSEPQISVEKQENTLLLKVTHDKVLSKVVYRLNSEEEINIDTQNNKMVEETIQLSNGVNKLYVTAEDINGEMSEYEEEYTVYSDRKPIIILSVTNDNKIKIVAKDEKAIKSISYSWNNENETVQEADPTNLTTIEQEIEIPYGQNTLKVIATNSEGVTSTKELDVKGINKPKVTVERDGDYLLIIAEDEKAMKVVDYTLNGKRYQLNFGEVKVIKYKQKLNEGENLLILTAENVDGGITEYKGKCTK